VALLDVSLVLVDHNDGYFLSRRHVVVGLDLERGRLSVKVAFKLSR